MRSTGLQGPFRLEPRAIENAVRKKLPGVFALGYTGENGKFVVEKLGRSDEDVRNYLHATADLKLYQEFGFEQHFTAKSAFEKECSLFHKSLHGKHDTHPERLEGSYWKCPECNLLD